jgi:malate/lactate dehydrogenase
VKVAVLGGGGGVGSSAAFNLLLGPNAHDVVLVDSRPEMVTSHVMDLEQVLEQRGTGSIRGGDLNDVLDADVVVVAASAPLTVNVSRLDYLLANAEIVEELVAVLAATERWPGTLVVVTNPVDPLCTWIQRRTGIERTRVLGYTLNDSLRLRTGSRRRCGSSRARSTPGSWASTETRVCRSSTAFASVTVPCCSRPRCAPRRRSSCARGTCGTSRSTRAVLRRGHPESASRRWSTP